MIIALTALAFYLGGAVGVFCIMATPQGSSRFPLWCALLLGAAWPMTLAVTAIGGRE